MIANSEERKGISNSTTFAYNLTKEEVILKNLQALIENVCISLRKEKKYAYVVGVTIRDKNFHNYSHQKKLWNASSSSEDIFKVAKELFLEMWDGEPIRLLGVSLTGLTDSYQRQLSLFEEEEETSQNQELDKVVDQLKKQYGSNIIQKASLMDNNIFKKYD